MQPKKPRFNPLVIAIVLAAVLMVWSVLGGTGGSARGGVCSKPLAITKAVHEGKAVLTIGGAPAYILPGGGIDFIVDAGKMVNHGVTWVPTPATVAPVEYTMTKADYDAIGGHMNCVKPIDELRKEIGE